MTYVINPSRFSSSGFSPTDITGLVFWLDAANRGSTTDQWDDLSGNANHFTAPSGQLPTFSGGIATFNGTSNYVTGPDLSSLTAGEVFVLLARYSDASESGTNTGFLHLGTATVPDHYAYNNVLYTCFGRGDRQNCGNPTPDLTNYLIFNAWCATNDWAVYLDGTPMKTASFLTPAFPSVSTIGAFNSASPTRYYFQGGMKSVIMYDRKLSTSERADVETYLGTL